MVDDVSHSDLTVDLRKHGEKMILAKKASSTISAHIEKKFKVEVMDPMIEKYRMLCAQDLAQRTSDLLEVFVITSYHKFRGGTDKIIKNNLLI